MSPESPAGRPVGLVVAVVLNETFTWSQNFITRELVGLVREGVDLRILTRQVADRDDLTPEEEALRQRILRLPENPFRPGNLPAQLRVLIHHPQRCARALWCWLTFGHRDLMKWLRSFVCLARAAAVAGRLEAHGVQLIHAHWFTAPTETALYLSILGDLPWGATGHAMDIYRDHSGLSTKLRQARYIVTETRTNAEHLRGIEPLTPIHAIYNGMPLPPEPKAPPPTDPFVFLAIGRLVPKKGFPDLLQACANLRSRRRRFRCLLVGRGPDQKALLDLARRLELGEHFRHVPFVPPNRMERVYRQGHALVMPCVIEPNGDRDGIPTVCVEAMAHGLPIIATRVSGLPEIVEDGVNGFLVPPHAPDDLSRAMERMLDHPDRKALGRAGRERVARDFDLERNVRALREILLANRKLRA